MRKTQKKILGLLIFLITCPLVAYHQRTEILAKLAEHFLTEGGLKDVEVIVRDIGPEALTLDSLNFAYDSGGMKCALAIRNVEINYHLDLLLAQQVSSIVVPEAKLHCDNEEHATDANSEKPPSVSLDQTLAKLPFSTLELGQLGLSGSAFGKEALNLSGSFKLDDQRQNLSSSLILQNTSGETLGKSLINLRNEKLNVDITAELLPTFALLKSFVPGLPADLRFSSGAISGKASLTLAPIMTGRASLNIKNLNGSYQEIIFKKLDLQTELCDVAQLKLCRAADIKVEKIQTVVNLEKIKANLDLRKTKNNSVEFQIKNISAGIFGGELQTKDVVFSFPRKTEQFLLTIKGIDVEKVLEFYPQKHVSATGTLDGTLPVTFSPEEISIQAGKLHARTKGIIRLHNAKDYSSSGSAAIAFQALENFHYDSLSAKIDYTGKGTLTLALSLQGRNPDLSGGRPINFNLSIEENIPALLKSINMAKDMAQAIDRKLQAGFKKP